MLLARFHEQLAAQGYVAGAGQMIDATFVEVPRQRNERADNARIKAGETPADWQQESAKPRRRQKDVEARWTNNNNEKHYGYQNHINADQGHQRMQSYQVTDASVPDSQAFEALLDQTVAEDDNKRAIYADSAYRSQEKAEQLAADNIPSQIGEKGARKHPLTEAQKASNQEKSNNVRASNTSLRQDPSTGSGQDRLWRAGADGRAHRAHHWPTACSGQDRHDESGIQQGALGAQTQARQERCACGGIKHYKRREKEQ